DAAPVPGRVRRLERVVVALVDVALDVLDLTTERGFDLRPRGRDDQFLGPSAVETQVVPGEPVRAVDRPTRLAPVGLERMRRALAATSICGQGIPDVQLQAGLALDLSVDAFERSGGPLVGDALEDGERIQ